MVKDQTDKEAQGCHQHINRNNEPEPRPVFQLSGKLAHRDGFEELGGKQSKEIANGVVVAGTPDVGGVLVADVEESVPVTQGDKAQLGLEDLIENNEQHQHQQTGWCTEDPLVGDFVMTEQYHQQRDGHDHPVVIVEADNVQLFAQLIGLCQRFLGVEQGQQTADDADIEHIVLDFGVLDPEEDGKQRDIRTADVDEPAIPEHSGLIHGVGRNVDFQKMQHQAESQQGKEPELLGQGASVAKTVI